MATWEADVKVKDDLVVVMSGDSNERITYDQEGIHYSVCIVSQVTRKGIL